MERERERAKNRGGRGRGRRRDYLSKRERERERENSEVTSVSLLFSPRRSTVNPSSFSFLFVSASSRARPLSRDRSLVGGVPRHSEARGRASFCSLCLLQSISSNSAHFLPLSLSLIQNKKRPATKQQWRRPSSSSTIASGRATGTTHPRDSRSAFFLFCAHRFFMASLPFLFLILVPLRGRPGCSYGSSASPVSSVGLR